MALGKPSVGWFRTLKTSARKSSPIRSGMGKVLEIPVSKENCPGPRRILDPELPGTSAAPGVVGSTGIVKQFLSNQLAAEGLLIFPEHTRSGRFCLTPAL